MIPDPPRILIVDDEEAILETMSFTFMDVYEVFTSTDARKGLEILEEHAPVACVITDQRMPGMTGVEFLAEVCKRHPDTARIMLTGFADAAATIEAINDGHVWAYVNKPWEPDELKQIVRRAVEHSQLAAENTRLLVELQATNSFLEAVMDRLDTGALAIDAEGLVAAANKPARDYLGLEEDPRGTRLVEMLEKLGVAKLGETVMQLLADGEGAFEDLELPLGDKARRLRVSAQLLRGADGDALEGEESVGCVILFREVSHEPLRRRFDEIVTAVGQEQAELRPRLELAIGEIAELATSVQSSEIRSPSLSELGEQLSRTQTAMQSWLDADDVLAREEYPDAQLLLDRMRVASQRWPYADALPSRVVELSQRIEAYYESGENPGTRVL